MPPALVPRGVNLHEDQGPHMRALLISMIVLPTFVVVIRFWSRALLPGIIKFWWDDWTALLAAVINIAVCGVGLKLVDLGLGRHIEVVPSGNISPFLKLLWVEYYIFDAGTAIAKTSALLFYTRIFSKAKPRFKWAVWTVHILNAIWLIAIIFAVIFECSPIRKAWVPELPGSCDNADTLWMGSGIPSLIIDFMILVLPLPVLWQLQVQPVRKYLIMLVFACGYLVIVVSIGRLVTIVQAGSSLSTDVTYNIATPVFWLGSEISISVISVSLPSLFFFFRRAYREGFYSLFSVRPRSSRSKLIDPADRTDFSAGHKHCDSTEMGPASIDSLRKGPFSGAASELHASAARASSEDITSPERARIHVRSEFYLS